MASIVVMIGTRKADTLDGTGKRRLPQRRRRRRRPAAAGQGGNDLAASATDGFDIADGGPGGDVCVTEVKAGCEA